MSTTAKASKPDQIALPRRPQWAPKSIWAFVCREIRDARRTSDRTHQTFGSDTTSIWIGLAAHHYLVSRAVNDRKIGTLLHLVARWGTTVPGQSFDTWSREVILARPTRTPVGVMSYVINGELRDMIGSRRVAVPRRTLWGSRPWPGPKAR